MKTATKHRIAAIAIGSAIGAATLTFGLRLLPMAQATLASLGKKPDPVVASALEAGYQPVAKNAVFLGSGSSPNGSSSVPAPNTVPAQPIVPLSGAWPIAVSARGLADGTYTGLREYAFYGYVRVKATVRGGQLTDVQAIEYPSDNPRSKYISSVAIPYLVQEAVNAQSYNVDYISGATFTSDAFYKSLRSALGQA